MVAVLTLGVLSAAFVLLAGLESTLAVGLRHQTQAEALAHAALDHALDAVQPAATFTEGFSQWIGTMVVDGARLGGGQYWARVDNDCEPLVPRALQEAGCPTATDTNKVAVVTGWAQAGASRARVRATAGVDHPWVHVCSDAAGEGITSCGDWGSRNPAPVVVPADPKDPNGPARYGSLPLPILGCSRIDPRLHDTPSDCPGGSRLVLTGEEPAGGGAVCHDDTGGAGPYFGYFDCALQTPCQPAAACPGGPTRGCVRPADTRLVTQPSLYREPGPAGCANPHPGSVTGDPSPATGMVFNYAGAPAARRNPRLGMLGARGSGVTIYVLRQGNDGQAQVQGGTVHGTLVVEGNGQPSGDDECSAANAEVLLADNATLRADARAYGYPLALAVYDPTQPAPTGPSGPQVVCARLGGGNAEVHGIAYSGGRIWVDPIAMDGSVVAFRIDAIGGTEARLEYGSGYGAAAPPPGFRTTSSGRVVVFRKSFVLCGDYREDEASPAPCD